MEAEPKINDGAFDLEADGSRSQSVLVMPLGGRGAPESPLGRAGYNNDHWLLFCGIFLFASLGGLAALLRSGQKITWLQTFSALLNSGMIGLIVSMVLWSRFAGQDIYLLIGISTMAGFGGATVVDLAVRIVKVRAAKFFGVDLDQSESKPNKPKR